MINARPANPPPVAFFGNARSAARMSMPATRSITRATASTNLYILNAGFFKIVKLAADGREQVVSLKFRGDWMGFDGIARAATPARPWR